MKKWKRPKYLQSTKEYYKEHPELVEVFGELANKIKRYLKQMKSKKTLKVTCPKCKGKGQIYNRKIKDYVVCSLCKRFGEIYGHEVKKYRKKIRKKRRRK